MSFSGENVLTELLGVVGLWAASHWKRLPQIHLEQTSTATRVVFGRITTSILLRVGAAVALVLLQILLVGATADSIWATPLITASIFMIAQFTGQFDSASVQPYTLLNPSNWSAPKLNAQEPILVPAISIVTSILLLWTNSNSIQSPMTGISLVVCGVGFFTLLSRAAKASDAAAEKTDLENTQSFLRSVALYAGGFSLLVMVLSASGMQGGLNLLVLLESGMRALQALGLILFAVENALGSSSTIAAASIAAAILKNSNGIPALGSLLAFSGLVGQLVVTAPKATDKRLMLFAFLFVPSVILPISSNAVLAPSDLKESVIDPLKSLPSNTFGQLHPVQHLHEKWTKHHNEKVARQSKTIQEAVAEYQKRYKRKPPPGFDHWFQYAQDEEYLFPDEFDTLMKSMEPFWAVSPDDLRARVKSVASLGNDGQIAELEVTDSVITARSWDHWHTNAIMTWFNQFSRVTTMPDFNFTLNVLDEPRAIFHPAYMERNADQPARAIDVAVESRAAAIDKNKVKWVQLQQSPTWSAVAPSCPNRGRPEINDESKYKYVSDGIEFMDASGSCQDVCVSSSLRMEHGFFLAPDTLKLTHNVVPIFSQAAPKRFGDIVYPTPFYWEIADGDSDENRDDIPWEAKANQTYWAGSSTGGLSNLENWRHLHRNRVSLMTSNQSTDPVILLQRTTLGRWKPYQSLWSKIAKYFDIRVTRLVQCEENACHEMEDAFELGEQPGNTALRYKYVLDIDGNSYTGRYYRLLKSNGCVIKATIFKEWHDDLLTPWVHYIPLSNSAQEFGEMMRFLISEPEGDAIGSSIAAEGQKWAAKVLRQEDMEVYAMRVFMEYGRLFDEGRDKNGYVLPDAHT